MDMKKITPLIILMFIVNLAFSQTKQFSLDDKDLKENSQTKVKTNFKGLINDSKQEKQTISSWKDVLNEYKQEKQPNGYYYQKMDKNLPYDEFNKASNNLYYSGVLLLGGGLLHLLASRDLSISSNLTADLNSRNTMAKIGTAMYCGAGIFVLSASFNIRNGAINLK
jgi:hypothetical protein